MVFSKQFRSNIQSKFGGIVNILKELRQYMVCVNSRRLLLQQTVNLWGAIAPTAPMSLRHDV
uniref:Uncharacterized protein n=1 Tax=Romanomermis culicivorax TaxID=13658 RepID=A0A915J0B5_ROMCU